MSEIDVQIDDVVYRVCFEAEPGDRFLGTEIDFDIVEVYDARGGRQNIVFDLCVDTIKEMEANVWLYIHYGEQECL